jgi:hypothetical protein
LNKHTDKQDYILEPNRIALAKYETNLTLERILFKIQERLQDRIRRSFKRLDLFDTDETKIKMAIPLRSVTHRNSLDWASKAAMSLMKMNVVMPILNEHGKTVYIKITHLVEKVTLPTKTISTYKRKNTTIDVPRKKYGDLLITMTQEQALRFCQIDMLNGKPANYTAYLKNVIENVKTAYAVKMYKLIKSWESKGGFVISVQELRELLWIDDKSHPTFGNIAQRILEPVKKNLEEVADCWFEYSPEKKEGKKIISIRIKIITRTAQNMENLKQENIKQLLRRHFEFDDTDMKGINRLFNSNVPVEKLVEKLSELHSYIANNRTIIKNKKAYVMGAINKLIKNYSKKRF